MLGHIVGTIQEKLLDPKNVNRLRKELHQQVKTSDGKGNADSHKKMPIVNDSPKNLYLNDFSTFKDLNSHFVMTAHILYKKIVFLFQINF